MNARHDPAIIDQTRPDDDDTAGWNPFGTEPWNDDYRCKNHPHTQAVEPVARRRCRVCMDDAQARYAQDTARRYHVETTYVEGDHVVTHLEVWKE